MSAVMLDIETMGTQPGSAIVSIGAVRFTEADIVDSFYERVDLKSCLQVGLRMDASTVQWWIQQCAQSPEACAEMLRQAAPLPDVLLRFSTWLDDPKTEVWGNSASFDNVLLREAYAACGLLAPWIWSYDRCYRTLKNLIPEVPLVREGTHHHALDDARSQARHCMALLGVVRAGRESLSQAIVNVNQTDHKP